MCVIEITRKNIDLFREIGNLAAKVNQITDARERCLFLYESDFFGKLERIIELLEADSDPVSRQAFETFAALRDSLLEDTSAGFQV